MPKNINVTKHDGSIQAFDRQKVFKSILRSQVDEAKAQEILSRVEKQLFDKISTKELYLIVNREIVRENLPHCSHLYRLREAVAAMDPIDFEKFIKEILTKEGFKTEWNLIIDGACIDHQLDVIAQTKKMAYYVEVKHHRRYHRDTDLGTMVELWGRFEDLKKGFDNSLHPYNFTAPWLITNTKFSQHAKKYAKCKKLRLSGWRYFLSESGREDSGRGLEKEIERLGVEQVSQLVRKVIEGRT